MTRRGTLRLIVFAGIMAGSTAFAQQRVTGPYLMAFHACDRAVSTCSDPQNHRTYLAQSSDGASWSLVAGFTAFRGSVPDVIQRGNTLYIYTPGTLSRYHLDTNTLDAPVPVAVSGLPNGFVDPSLILDDQGRIVMFYLQQGDRASGDPAVCASTETSCTKRFGSATETSGSDGSRFTVNSGDRVAVTIQSTGTIRSASDPDIFFDGTKYVLYISHGSSTSVWTSSTMAGTYTSVSTLPGGMLNDLTGGIASGYFDLDSRRYWTFSHVSQSGVSVIRRAVHADFSRQVAASDWTSVITGTTVGLTATTHVESPGFTTYSSTGVTTPLLGFAISDRGGVSRTTSGGSGALQVGYGRIQAGAGSTTPAGLAIFGFRPNDVLVSEAGVPASPLVSSGRIYAEIGSTVNTGLAIANPNRQAAAISFYFTDAGGNFGSGTATIPANGQIAAFLNQSPFNGRPDLTGSFTFSSNVPVGVIALRGLTNERSEFLITTLPVSDLSATASTGAVVFPHFADGGGWTTQIALVNPTDSALTGSVQFVDSSGNPVTLTVEGQTGNSFTYSVPSRSAQRLRTAGTGQSISVGSVRATPAGSGTAPAGVAVFSFRSGAIAVSEAGVPAIRVASAFRIYGETAGNFDAAAVGAMQSGVAIANLSSSPATVTIEVTRLDASSTGLTGTITVPANGHVARFLNQIQGLTSLAGPFQGVLRISSTSSISVVGLRGRYNERNDFLITTTPPIDETASASSSELVFPHFADAGGYTTQFILFSGSSGQQSSGALQLYSQSGQALQPALR